jgi:pyruvate dehydrogenase E1 component alpha subunit
VPGVVVDGNDVLAVYEVAQAAVRRARAGEGPTLLECKTYRWRNHTEIKGIPDSRPANEIAAWKEKDTISRFMNQLKEQRILTDADWQVMDEQILHEIDQAVSFAKESPFPPLAAALEDVFAS